MKNSMDFQAEFLDVEGIDTKMIVDFREREESVVPGFHDAVCFSFVTKNKLITLHYGDGGQSFMLDKSQVGHLIDVLSSFHKNMKEREK